MTQRSLFTIIIFLTIANFLIWGLLGVERAYANRVYPGVWVNAQPLSGLTREQAIDRLAPVNNAMLLQKVTLILADKQYEPTLADLGYQVNTATMADAALSLGRGPSLRQIVLSALDYRKSRTIPIAYDIDQGKFDAYLNQISQDVVKEPKNMALDYTDGTITTTPASEGIILNKEELRQAIQREARPGKSATITLSFTKTSPTIKDASQVEAAKSQLTALLSRSLVIQAEEVTTELTPTDIYQHVYFDTKDNALTVNIDENKVRETITKIAKKVDKKAVAKQVSAVNNQIIQEGEDGRQLNAPDSVKRIMERLQAADLEAPVILKVDKIDRSVTTISPEFVTGRYPGRYLEVDLSAQRMHLIEGDQYHRTFIISTGKWSNPTPIGEFTIKNHIKTAWSNRYGLYMPFWMAIQTPDGFYDGYGIHGLPYWPDGTREGESHLGRPVSHGCIRLGASDIEYLYEWAQNGTNVVIHQ